MFSNYYISGNKTESVELKVLKTGKLTSKRGCDSPYAIVDYHGFEKQLVFSCNLHVDNTEFIKVELQTGLFGFKVAKKCKLVSLRHEESNSIKELELEKQHIKILKRAEEYYADGNSEKSIELYERAVQLKPTDKLAKIRLNEIKKLTFNYK